MFLAFVILILTSNRESYASAYDLDIWRTAVPKKAACSDCRNVNNKLNKSCNLISLYTSVVTASTDEFIQRQIFSVLQKVACEVYESIRLSGSYRLDKTDRSFDCILTSESDDRFATGCLAFCR